MSSVMTVAHPRGLCGTCGRRLWLAADGTLPHHQNIGAAWCAGEGQEPWPAPLAAEQDAREQLAAAGDILAALAAAGLVAVAR